MYVYSMRVKFFSRYVIDKYVDKIFIVNLTF